MEPARTDLTTAEDIDRLLRAFYADVLRDADLAPHFDGVVMDTHIPHIATFWHMVVLGERSYTGDPMTVHERLHARRPLRTRDFDRWLALFVRTVDAHFAGPKAEMIKERARAIAPLMAHQVGALTD
ncbi:MAG: group III truncated hemoglobin [Flavobacteriales bacterium]|nr:group III truncated hemoglobin [Flavobacteriales bacterium]MCB9167476.1 group III truncated hemoglobin [Flavobacteriales bacterium]